MRHSHSAFAAAAVIGSGLLLAACASMNQPPLGFFVTSSNPGKGADFGGLAGADAHCQALAASVGAGSRTWRAYLSAAGEGGAPAVNARDRIGRGPWKNANWIVIANNVDELHGPNANITKQTTLTERGKQVSGRGDPVNTHDILTGSTADGRLATGAPDTTCGNWTRSGAGSAIVGHSDRLGLRDDEQNRSWNASHPSRGCGVEALKASGGAGLLYCFAAD
jgi:hypothetical protein